VPKKSDFSQKSDFSNRVPKRAQEDFLEKLDFSNRARKDFSNRAQSAQEILFLGKIGFLKPCPKCPRNPIFGKNRISQTVHKVPKKSYFWEKSDFSNSAQGAHQEIRVFGKNRISQTVPKRTQEIFGKNRISKMINHRRRTGPLKVINHRRRTGPP
jgi:hypothetical protein